VRKEDGYSFKDKQARPANCGASLSLLAEFGVSFWKPKKNQQLLYGPPIILHECQNKGVAKKAFRK
jgi:hypothetical protein